MRCRTELTSGINIIIDTYIIDSASREYRGLKSPLQCAAIGTLSIWFASAHPPFSTPMMQSGCRPSSNSGYDALKMQRPLASPYRSAAELSD